jgi:hypothetical protein
MEVKDFVFSETSLRTSSEEALLWANKTWVDEQTVRIIIALKRFIVMLLNC